MEGQKDRLFIIKNVLCPWSQIDSGIERTACAATVSRVEALGWARGALLLLVVRACRLWPARELRTAESARRGGSGGVRLERRAPADRGRCAAPPVAVIEAAWPVLPSPMAEGAAAGRRRCAPLPRSGALLGPDSLLTT